VSIYSRTVDKLPEKWKAVTTVVRDTAALNERIAGQFADLLEDKMRKNELLTVITAVGPLDYSYFVKQIVDRGLDCRFLRCVNMDEYIDENDQWIPYEHPLSFRRFMDETFFDLLPTDNRPKEENIVFPHPSDPQYATDILRDAGGADICWGGFGITGHLAFNDPPEMLGEPTDLESFRATVCRKVVVSRMAKAQMAMGGTDGNLDIIPERAVTLGMSDLLGSKTLHLTFMRKWHAGLWRRALLGEVSSSFPGSLAQTHPNVQVTMTELAARVPGVNTSQETGESPE